MRKRWFKILISIVIIAIFTIIIFSVNKTKPTITDIPLQQTKAELQEQLALELNRYYMGADNLDECTKLIEQIDGTSN